MKKILIPIENSSQAEQIKSSLLALNVKHEYEIELLHVVHVEFSSADLEKDISSVYDEGSVIGESIKKVLDAAGFQVHLALKKGITGRVIAEYVEKLPADLVIMLTHGVEDFSETFFGTHTSKAIRDIQVPVIVMPHNFSFNPVKKAVVGLQLDNENLQMVQKAIDFAEAHKIDLKYVKIEDPTEIDIISDRQVEKKLTEMYPGHVKEIVHHPGKNVVDGLYDYVQLTGAGLLILFSTEKNLLEKLFEKSITQKMVKDAKFPLLIFHDPS